MPTTPWKACRSVKADEECLALLSYLPLARFRKLPQFFRHSSVLPALVFTTAAIIAGFGVLALSEFTLIRNLGLVTSGLVFLCLLADLTLLPPLLLSVDRKSL